MLLCAANKISSTSSPKSLTFDEVTVQRGQGYNLSTGHFNPPMDGVYFFHLSSGLMPYTGVHIEMRTSTSLLITHVYHTSTIHDGFDMTSVAFIGTFTKDTPIYLYVSNGTTRSDSLRQTSWSAFLLDNLMYPLIAFCVRPQAGIISDEKPKVDFSVTNFNFGNAWNSTTDTFTTPRDGVYVFSVSFSTTAATRAGVVVYVNNVINQRMFIVSTNHNGYIMAGKTFAIVLTAGDLVFLESNNGLLYSDNYYVMSFAGFLYEPLNSRKIIWSVHKNSYSSGQFNPLPFDVVAINEGNGWNNANNKFTVSYAGIYQLHLTSSSKGNGAADYRLMWNDVAYVSILSATQIYDDVITRSRSVMIEASVGDTFYIATTSSTSLYGYNSETTFTGYLIVA